MKVIELPLGNFGWPRCCCGCGRSDFDYRPYTENVVIWTVLSVTAYRPISLLVPTCRRCAHKHLYWYAGAGVMGALTIALLAAIEKNFPIYGGLLMGLLVAPAFVMFILGTMAKPLKVLGYNESDGTIKVKFRNDQVATELLKNPGSRPSSHKIVRRSYLIALGAVVLIFVGVVISALYFK